VAEDLGFAEAVTDFPEDAESLLVACGSLGEVAEAVFCVAEAVPGGGLVLTVAEFVVQG
jgi:hypothetical protein